MYDETTAGLARVDLARGRSAGLPAVGAVGTPYAVSADRRLLVTSRGQIVDLGDGDVHQGLNKVAAAIGGDGHIGSVPPMADGDRYVVQGGLSSDGYYDFPLRFFDIATRTASRTLGRGDAVTGDPASEAAWLSIASGPPVTAGSEGVLAPDSSIQHRASVASGWGAPGARPVTVGRAGRRHSAAAARRC